jgi:hypothetical protein
MLAGTPYRMMTQHTIFYLSCVSWGLSFFSPQTVNFFAMGLAAPKKYGCLPALDLLTD